MIQEEIKIRVLIPSDGYKLTQSADVALGERIISTKIYLSVKDSPENWKEITEEEATEIEVQKNYLSAERLGVIE